jgi:hypothetical protein
MGFIGMPSSQPWLQEKIWEIFRRERVSGSLAGPI